MKEDELMLYAVDQFFNAFGATIVVPLMIFIIALFLKVKVKTAVISALYAGVGLTGFSWIISEFTPVVTKIIRQMVNNVGIKLPVVDIGWQAGSLASFNSTVGLAFFVFGLIIEFLLFALGITKVFMPSNLWNNFGFMIWGTLAYYVTHNFWLSIGLSCFMLLYTLELAEIQADRWSSYYQINNTTVSAAQNIVQTVPAILLDPLWNYLGFNKVHFTPTSFRQKFGIFGQPTTLGAILGLFIGILGNLNRITSYQAWGQICQFAIQLAAVMTIFPLVTDIFAKAFKPLASSIDQQRQTVSNEASDPIHHRKRWFLAVDDGVGYGEPATIISGIILIPIMVIIAFILPGNRTLPVVDLISLPFMVESIVAVTNGNILKVIANGIVWFSLGLYCSSWLGPFYTATLTHYGAAIPAGVVLITSFNLMARPLNAVVFAAFISKSPLWIGLCIIIYLGLLFVLRRYRPQIWTYLNQMAAKNAGTTTKSYQKE